MSRPSDSFFNRRKLVEPGIPLRWKLYLAVSTAGFLGLAGIIADWPPVYHPIAWTLVLFSFFHLSLLVVQRVGCEPSPPDNS